MLTLTVGLRNHWEMFIHIYVPLYHFHLGECWGGSGDYQRHGLVPDNCSNFEFGVCLPGDGNCVGKANANFVYQIAM